MGKQIKLDMKRKIGFDYRTGKNNPQIDAEYVVCDGCLTCVLKG